MIDKKFWLIFKKMEWNKDFNDKRISMLIKQKKYGDIKTMVSFLDEYYKKENNLYTYINKMSESEYEKYIGASDDGLGDIISHIIGNGENVYNSVFNNKKNFLKYKNSYKEKFSYSFNDFLTKFQNFKKKEKETKIKETKETEIKNNQINSINNEVNINMDFI